MARAFEASVVDMIQSEILRDRGSFSSQLNDVRVEMRMVLPDVKPHRGEFSPMDWGQMRDFAVQQARTIMGLDDGGEGFVARAVPMSRFINDTARFLNGGAFARGGRKDTLVGLGTRKVVAHLAGMIGLVTLLELPIVSVAAAAPIDGDGDDESSRRRVLKFVSPASSEYRREGGGDSHNMDSENVPLAAYGRRLRHTAMEGNNNGVLGLLSLLATRKGRHGAIAATARLNGVLGGTRAGTGCGRCG